MLYSYLPSKTEKKDTCFFSLETASLSIACFISLLYFFLFILFIFIFEGGGGGGRGSKILGVIKTFDCQEEYIL